MDSLIRFFSFTDPNVRYVVAGMLLLAIASSVIGTFSFLRKKALAGDAVSHAVLPGVCLSFMLTGEKNLFGLMLGAFISGLISLFLVDYIRRNSKLKEDTAIGLILSVFFGFGLVLLTYIQHQGNAAQSGLDGFIFGKAAVLLPQDVLIFGVVAILLLTVVFFFYKELKLFCFDPNFAKSIGISINRLEYLLTGLMVMAIVIGIQSVGVVLMAALLITPAAIARFWTNKLERMIALAVLFSMLAGITGAYVSFVAPRMPTGPWIVVVLSVIAMASFLLAPEKGMLLHWIKKMKAQRIIADENVLKAMYQLGETSKAFQQSYSLDDIFSKRNYSSSKIRSILNRLQRQGFVEWNQGNVSLTKDGVKKGSLITRRHRLWESYLTEVVNIAPDHVHEDADVMEHLLNEELETRLVAQLKDPSKDPHQSDIPTQS